MLLPPDSRLDPLMNHVDRTVSSWIFISRQGGSKRMLKYLSIHAPGRPKPKDLAFPSSQRIALCFSALLACGRHPSCCPRVLPPPTQDRVNRHVGLRSPQLRAPCRLRGAGPVGSPSSSPDRNRRARTVGSFCFLRVSVYLEQSVAMMRCHETRSLTHENFPAQ